MEAKKNPDAVWKPEPIAKKASSFKSDDPFHNMIMLVAKLREAGRVEDADRLMTKVAAYQKTAKDVHLYRAIDEDGEDLLEFAYPDGDVEVAKAEGEHGKVHTPQNAHKRIVDIVQKNPTGGKQASASEMLLKSLASDLGIEKKALDVNLVYKNAVERLKKSIPAVSEGPLFHFAEKFPHQMIYFQFGNSWHFGFTGRVESVYRTWVDTNWNVEHTMKHEKWGLFNKVINDPNFDENIKSGAFSREALNKYMQKAVNKANEGMKSIYKIPLGVVNELEKLDPKKDALKIDRLLSRLENENDCGWIVNTMTLATSQDKSDYDAEVARIRGIVNPLIQQSKREEAKKKAEERKQQAAVKSRMLSAKAKYDKVIQLTNEWPAMQQYCKVLSTAISKYPTSPYDAITWARASHKNAPEANNDREAIVKLEADSSKALAKVEAWRKNASLKTTLNKTADAEDIAAPSKKKAPAGKPAPRRSGGGGKMSYREWSESVAQWQKKQDEFGSSWYKSVKALQVLLVDFGSTAVLEQVKAALTKKDPKKGKAFSVESVQSDILNTGWALYGESHQSDGKWGPATSKSILTVKKILDMFGVDTSTLDVPTNGVLGASSDIKEEKDKWGLLAQQIRQKILAFSTEYRITGLAGGAAAGTAASKDSVFDMLPQDPIHVTGYDPAKTGNIPLRGKDLENLRAFNSWLIGNRLVPIDATGSFSMKVRDWLVTVFDNLKKRARYLQSAATEAKDDAKQALATEYLNAVMALEQQFQDAISKWMPAELARQKASGDAKKGWSLVDVAKNVAVSLLELFSAAGGTPTTESSSGAASSSKSKGGESGTDTEGTTGPEIITDEQKQEYFPIGYDIYPPSWQRYGYDAGTQIFSNNLVPGYPMNNYISFRVNVNDVRGAYDVDAAMAAIMQPAVESIPIRTKLKVLNRAGAKTPQGVDLTNVAPSSPAGRVIENKFNAYVLFRVAKALRMDVLRVAQNYGRKEWAQNHQEWANAVHQNAQSWARHLKRVESMAARAFGSDSASGQVSRFFV